MKLIGLERHVITFINFYFVTFLWEPQHLFLFTGLKHSCFPGKLKDWAPCPKCLTESYKNSTAKGIMVPTYTSEGRKEKAAFSESWQCPKTKQNIWHSNSFLGFYLTNTMYCVKMYVQMCSLQQYW